MDIKENAAIATNGVASASGGVELATGTVTPASAVAPAPTASDLAGGAGADAAASDSLSSAKTAAFIKKFSPLLPSIFGMAFARGGLIVAGYGSYVRSDEGLFTDGAMMIAIVVMIAIEALFYFKDFRLNKRLTNAIERVSIVVEALVLLAMVLLGMSGNLSDLGRLLLSAVATLSGSGCIFYWLRRARGCSSLTAAIYVFFALAISEVEIYVCAVTGTAGFFVATALTLVQFPLMVAARKRPLAESIDTFAQRDDYFGIAKDTQHSNYLLVATATSLGTLFLVVGFLRGYPSGDSIAFTPITRIAYALLTILICVSIIFLLARRRRNVTTVAMFVMFELLAIVALVLYAAFPDQLDIGAVFTTTLNALMCGFMWYITISFMGFGWRDPYYYAFGGWIACLGCRCVARVVFIVGPMPDAEDVFINALMGGLLLVSTQISLGQFLSISRASNDRREKQGSRRIDDLERRLAQASQANVVMVGAGIPGEEGSCASCDTGCVTRADVGPTLADILPHEDDAARNAEAHPYANRLQRIMGLDGRPNDRGSGAGGADVAAAEASPQEHARRRAEQVGRQFMLSDREVEVLSLYALGWTQKRVAEELFISPATAHAHIKRIYAKTDLHSRQEILDYMEQYTD